MIIKFEAIILLLLFFACQGNSRIEVAIETDPYSKEVVYKTEKANFHFDYKELIKYCQKEDNGEPNDFAFEDIIKYIESYPVEPVVIPNTLGTKLEKESAIGISGSDSLIRIRDQDHPYGYVTDDVEWAIIKFAKKGDLRVFDKYSNSFTDTIIVDDVETDSYGEINIHLKNDTIIFSVLTWIN